MEKTRLKQEAQILSPCSSGRRSSASNSPDFEFWMVRNPSFPTPNLVSADELFVNGVLLPLHLLPHHSESDPPDTEPPIPTSEQDPPPVQNSGPGPELTAVTHESTTGSKRWKDILFKKGSSSHDKKAHEDKDKDKDKDNNKEKKKERKSSQSRTSSAELNINIWPFSRSRSAGNNGTRPRLFAGAPGTRKVSSAPCSRSNSAGESKSRKWPSSPSRAGVHLGRSSPVWQVRRGGSGLKPSEPVVRNAEKGVKKELPEIRRSKTPTVAAAASAAGGGGAKARVLNLNVPMCISYRSHLSCKSDENNAISVATGGGGGGNGGGGAAHSGSSGGGGNLFGLRNLFTKKVY